MITAKYKKNPGLFKQIYALVKKIPKGKVATYGQLAQMLELRDVRKIGWALHGNKDPKIPCHRVVNKDGRVATNYAFEGWEEQKRKLLNEGVIFKDEKHVDLASFQWNVF